MLPFAEILAALQERGKNGDADWKALEPAMERLAQLLATPDERAVIAVAGNSWWLEIGPVELGAEVITIQRESELIAAVGRRDDGRLRVAVFRPLDSPLKNGLQSRRESAIGNFVSKESKISKGLAKPRFR